jgi:hypothetical protein
MINERRAEQFVSGDAGFWNRLAAASIDGIIIMIELFVI